MSVNLDFLKIPLTVAVLILAVVAFSRNNLLDTVLAIIGLIFYFGYFIFRERLEFWYRKKGWGAFHWWESLKEGGIKEAQIYRPLTEYESYTLKLRFMATKDKSFDLDQRSPVFRVIGNLIRRGEGESEVAEIRGLKITKENSPSQLYQRFREESDIAVEFSPFSKHVWEMYRVLGEKRIWYFHLPGKQIQQIREGKKKLDLRAPFGFHNLQNLKVGDYITYTDQGVLTAKVEIVGLNHESSLAEVIKKEDLKEIDPQAEKISDLVNYVKTLPSYEARIKQSGIYAIKFRKVEF